ncbi:MAG: hypothetical protein HYU68_09545 [Bacteroidetes bacterium]|nr:hypothetical protein [Bacteroidota bacterium]
MFTEIRKSTNAILFERVTSPLFGTLIVSWLIWNWKIIYLTLFISESTIEENKIDYIASNYNDIHFLVTFPLISTFLLLTIIPFVSNGAYWITIKFKKWRIDQKNEIEKTQVLTIEQSVSIRQELRDKEMEFEKILEKRNLEEKILKSQIEELELRLAELEPKEDPIKTNRVRKSNSGSSYGSSEYKTFKTNKKVFEPFEKIATSIRNDFQFPKGTSEELKEYYLINDIAEEKWDTESGNYYVLTFKGNGLYKDFFNEKFENKEE